MKWNEAIKEMEMIAMIMTCHLVESIKNLDLIIINYNSWFIIINDIE